VIAFHLFLPAGRRRSQDYNAPMSLLRGYMAHFGMRPNLPPRELLEKVLETYSALPYEDLAKIIKKSRRIPTEVIRDHIDWGTDGTCFSLTSALMELVCEPGWEAQWRVSKAPARKSTQRMECGPTGLHAIAAADKKVKVDESSIC
jgi:hypothetical protein